jgi:hypothetical protein
MTNREKTLFIIDLILFLIFLGLLIPRMAQGF